MTDATPQPNNQPNNQPGGQPAAQPNPTDQRVNLRIDESKAALCYCNTVRTSTTQDEVILDLGLNIPAPQEAGKPQLVVFNVGSRVVMNWASAKRLTMTLGQMIRQYEERFGEIQVNQQR